jgi:ketosteroid isomerase-like protein
MSQENVELIRRGVEAFNRRDLDTLFELLSPDVEFIPYLANLIETTTYHGHAGLRSYFEDADAAWEEIHVRVDEVREAGDQLVWFGELSGRGRASGLEVRLPLAWIGEVTAGRITRIQSYETREEALAAVGLSE